MCLWRRRVSLVACVAYVREKGSRTEAIFCIVAPQQAAEYLCQQSSSQDGRAEQSLVGWHSRAGTERLPRASHFHSSDARAYAAILLAIHWRPCRGNAESISCFVDLGLPCRFENCRSQRSNIFSACDRCCGLVHKSWIRQPVRPLSSFCCFGVICRASVGLPGASRIAVAAVYQCQAGSIRRDIRQNVRAFTQFVFGISPEEANG